jgi:hypothetical protein
MESIFVFQLPDLGSKDLSPPFALAHSKSPEILLTAGGLGMARLQATERRLLFVEGNRRNKVHCAL